MSYLPWLASDRNPPDLCFLSSWDYRHEPLVPSSVLHFFKCILIAQGGFALVFRTRTYCAFIRLTLSIILSPLSLSLSLPLSLPLLP
jgi:hypothetical protein